MTPLYFISAWGYRRMKEVYPESGILAVAYERPYGEFSRLLQYSMSYLASGAQVSAKTDK